jgi:uncharacterized protein YhaN
MKLLELHINGFGKFHDRTIPFEDGINVIYGKNEAGKSTLHTFIRGMLFGIERGRGRASKNDLYTKYEPWENSGAYEGWLRLASGDTVYRIERRFRKENKTFRIINETLGREEEPTKALMDRLLCGLNETSYNNTISIGQLKSATEESMAGELKNYIANMNTTGNIALNITRASSFLRNKRRSLEANLVPDASREYTALLAEIRGLDLEVSSSRYENQLPAYQQLRRQIRETVETAQNEKDTLDHKLQDAKKLLADHHFSDRSSVTSCLEQCRSFYNHFNEASLRQPTKLHKAAVTLIFLLALYAAGSAVWLGLSDFDRFLPLCAGAGCISILFFSLAFLLSRRNRATRKSLLENKAALSELFQKYLDMSDVSEQTMECFENKMKEYLELCDMISQSENALKKSMEEINSLHQKQNGCSEMIENQQRTQWELEKKLEYLNQCKTRASALKRVLAENDRIREEIAAIDMAQETMTDLSSSIRNSFGLYLNQEASHLLAGITGGIYNSMSIDENLNVFLNTRTRLVPLEHVSSGTIDQVYLALRLAAARLLSGDSGPLPLIFDDSFTQYDDERLRTAIKWLADSHDSQILLFTCHHRESQLLRANQIPFHLIEI